MSFENYPSAENTAKPDNSWQTKKRDYLIALLVIALLGTWAYIIWDKSQTRETIQQKDLVITNTSSERDQLKKELEEATMMYDQIKTHSANMVQSKDSTIFRRDREIREKQNKIQQLLSKVGATREELAQAKVLITSLQEDIQGYRTKVETLQAEKRVLTEEKRSVTQQRDNFQRNFDSANNVIMEKEGVIDIASTLHASNFSILGINEKNGGKEQVTTVAKRVDKLRISFDIDENRVAQSGEKKLYICITDPDGKPLAVEALGSGKFSTRDGAQKYFTHKIDINYTQGQRQTLSLDWKQNSSFATGEYKIEVYNNGFKIGEGIRILKKGGLFS
ncbi:MAG: hypothetical protein IPL84_13655 [Chitinophagaceae bacterium]|nr:hypothetical protein [Chitinophagaceae bacterium]